MGERYTIADIMTFPWVNGLQTIDGARELVGLAKFRNVGRVLQAFLQRPAVVKGLKIPAAPAG
jgi:GST-like protein